MAVHTLVLFWRDRQARCFTAWHFQPPSGERASHRAQKILSVVTQLSALQIYGAALDDTSLRFEPDNVVPSFGTDTRLEVSLKPSIPGQVGGGQIRFSIPGPAEPLSHIVESKQFSAPEWQLLEKELISYLCSPKGIPVSVAPDHLQRAEIARLDSEHRPQPGEVPFSAALARTQEALDAARRALQQTPTQKVSDRIERHSERRKLLQTWSNIEAQFFSQSEQQPRISQLQQIAANVRNRVPLISTKQEVIMSEQKAESEQPLLPKAPTKEEVALWEDVPKDHFSRSSMWTHRSQLRSKHGLNERTYYRWLKELGIKRSLPAEGNARVTLFYQPDLAQALALSQSHAHHAPAAEASSAVSSHAPELVANSQLTSLINMVADLAEQQKTITSALSRLEVRLAEQRQADLNQIAEQFSELARKQEEISLRLPQGHLLDLMAQLVNLNQLPSAIRQLNSNVKKLTEPKAKKATKAKSTAKSKGKKKTTK